MEARKTAARLLKEYVRPNTISTDSTPTMIVDCIIEAVKRDLRKINVVNFDGIESLLTGGGAIKPECAECMPRNLSGLNPSCLKPGCLREMAINLTPKLIQGHTAEQWQEIIDGGYLCEFGNHASGRNIVFDNVGILRHRSLTANIFFVEDKSGGNFKFCRPAQIKGVMRPIWVEPVDKNAKCVFFDVTENGALFNRFECSWSYYITGGIRITDQPTKYIEV